ncbi:GNAT family N-acetyltransferase [Nibribacter ruber]|uniref:GNAT family N-acetyltransferase n=1 Tax=Nibribacter ruber TaxID=2698458 RepID=A0A6P1P060_9BACT|nr:GNAT family N-acetyltransferase [Nibribacter ruber]QHL86302.1 GNAT family N-acetyltransferase [Nibribacter ruber]
MEEVISAVETNRLRLVPLSREQLDLYLLNDGSLERQMGVGYSMKEINPDLQSGLQEHFIPLVAQHPDAFYFFTLWSIVLKEENVLVGDICFKGAPDEDGQVEIGYGTYDAFQQRGIMAEAVGALLSWCQHHPNIKLVLAETEAGNTASEKTLLKNGFQCYHKGRDNSWWKKRIKN